MPQPTAMGIGVSATGLGMLWRVWEPGRTAFSSAADGRPQRSGQSVTAALPNAVDPMPPGPRGRLTLLSGRPRGWASKASPSSETAFTAGPIFGYVHVGSAAVPYTDPYREGGHQRLGPLRVLSRSESQWPKAASSPAAGRREVPCDVPAEVER